MSWLLFMDESGHDHRNMPFEARGGVAIHSSRLWAFVRAWQAAEREIFGVRLIEYGKEIKGHKLLDRDRFKWAAQSEELADDERQAGVRRFLTLSLEGRPPSRRDFTAYGQACVAMARQALLLLKEYGAKAFISMIPRGVKPPPDYEYGHFLRRDHVFLLERFFYFLEERREHGLLVMDETERQEDRRFVSRLESYFTKTQTGRDRTEWIVPVPFFVGSHHSIGIQAADIVLYSANWGFRVPSWGFQGAIRPEIDEAFSRLLFELNFSALRKRNGKEFSTFGIFFVADPYGSNIESKRR